MYCLTFDTWLLPDIAHLSLTASSLCVPYCQLLRPIYVDRYDNRSSSVSFCASKCLSMTNRTAPTGRTRPSWVSDPGPPRSSAYPRLAPPTSELHVLERYTRHHGPDSPVDPSRPNSQQYSRTALSTTTVVQYCGPVFPSASFTSQQLALQHTGRLTNVSTVCPYSTLTAVYTATNDLRNSDITSRASNFLLTLAAGLRAKP